MNAIFGNIADAARDNFFRVRVRHVRAFEKNLPAFHAAQAVNRLNQFALPVAGNARNAENFAFPHAERHAVDRLQAFVVQHVQILDGQHVAPRRALRLFDVKQHLAPNHHAG